MGATAPATSWYFAEGYTGGGFDQYLTILNPNPGAAPVTITYYLSDGTTRAVELTAVATSRTTVAVHETAQGVGRGQAVAARVTTTHLDGIVVERPIYFTYTPAGATGRGGGGAIPGGHNVMGALAPRGRWYFAEGYTGSGFDEYLTILNPDPAAITVTITYYVTGGSPSQQVLTVAGTARATVAVHAARPGVAVAAVVETSSPAGIVVERPMYFRYLNGITDGHVVMGAPAPAPAWYFAEGYTGAGFDEYLTILNPNPDAAPVTITYYLADGTTRQATLTVGAATRATVAVHEEAQGVGRGQAVSAKVATTNPGGIVVERPMYFTYQAGGRLILGGHNVMGYIP
jgi:hypothetical protein